MNSDVIESINTLFNPRNVVIYRASEKLDYFLIGLKEQAYNPDKVYLINSSQNSLFGFKCFKSIGDIPEETIDLLILAVARDKINENLKNLISQKKIKTIHIFTAGMGESDDLGKEIEKESMQILQNNGIRAIGPNCMGVYSPNGNLAYEPLLPTEPGNNNCVFRLAQCAADR